jgi:hypothetical protein
MARGVLARRRTGKAGIPSRRRTGTPDVVVAVAATQDDEQVEDQPTPKER